MDANITAMIIGGIAGLLTATVPVVYQAIKDRRTQAQDDITSGIHASKDAADVVITYSGELRKLRAEYEQLRTEMDVLRQERQADRVQLAEWQHGIDRLIAQIISLEHVPVWRPTPRGNP